ncbi:hypothetical protein AX16_005821 [Volvariella volvacea WC 439]|nr:hypothetical protein AX16_005821 [Volvariella volvacea WC 439]
MSLPYQDKITNLDNQIRHHYACIRELCEIRNTLIPIHQLPTEILCRVFKEVGLLNRDLSRGSALIWHPNIVHVCRRWRSIGLETTALWECISPQRRVQDAALACYIQRARMGQDVGLISTVANWAFILSLLQGSAGQITSVTATRSRSAKDFLRAFDQFEVAYSIRTLKLVLYPEQDVEVLPMNLPCFDCTHQEQLRNLLLNACICIPWEPLRPKFTGLQKLSAGVNITSRQDCLSLLNALEHMDSLQELHLIQYPNKNVDTIELKKLYHEIVPHRNQHSHIRPFSIELEGYGDVEIQLIITPLSLVNLQLLRLNGAVSLLSNHFLNTRLFLQDLLSISFRNLTQLEDGTWPALTILQNFPKIQKLVIHDKFAGEKFLPSSGLSCLWKLPQDQSWQANNVKWRWTQLWKEELAICIVNPRNSHPISARRKGERSGNLGVADDPLNDSGSYGYTLPPDSQVFDQSKRGELYALVTSLVPGLEVLEVLNYDLVDVSYLELLRNCVYFRRAIGLPMLKVVFAGEIDDDIKFASNYIKQTGVEVEFKEHTYNSDVEESDSDSDFEQ